VRPRRKVRFARFIGADAHLLGGPSARAEVGGSLSLPGCYFEWSARAPVVT
jgi:hypothetical protein